jgi:polar amino acid transport system permease protein
LSFSWPVFWAHLVDPKFLAAAWTTIWVAVVGQSIGTLVGFVAALGLLRGRGAAHAAARIYITIWRGTPLLAQLLLLYFGLPQLGLRLSVYEAGLIGLSLYSGAYMTEITRAAILSIDSGQSEASRSLGMSGWQAMRFVVLPQAVRVILPPLGNEFNSMLRTTSLLSVISLEELLRVTIIAISDTFRSVELYAVAAVYYLAMTTVWTIIQMRLERRHAAGVAGASLRLHRGAA